MKSSPSRSIARRVSGGSAPSAETRARARLASSEMNARVLSEVIYSALSLGWAAGRLARPACASS